MPTNRKDVYLVITAPERERERERECTARSSIPREREALNHIQSFYMNLVCPDYNMVDSSLIGVKQGYIKF